MTPACHATGGGPVGDDEFRVARRSSAVTAAHPPPTDGGSKHQVMFRAPAGDGEPWKRVLRRANSEEEAHKIFAHAEAALDTEQATPVGADVRASRAIRMLGEEYLENSIERGKHPRTIEQRESRLNAHSCPPSATFR